MYQSPTRGRIRGSEGGRSVARETERYCDVGGGWVGGQDKQLHGRTFTVSDENRHTKIHFFNSITFFFPTTQTEHELTIICYTLTKL